MLLSDKLHHPSNKNATYKFLSFALKDLVSKLHNNDSRTN